MSMFDDREDKYEKKFAHDAALKFKAEARRNKMLGKWAADLLGLSPAQADEYVAALIRADLQEAGDEDVFRKLRADFDAAGIGQTDQQIRRRIEEFFNKAVQEIQTQG